MSNIQNLANHIVELVGTDEVLSGFLGNGKWLYLGLPESYPSITIDGVTCLDDKLGTYTLTLNLFSKVTDDTADKLAHLEMTDRFKNLLAKSPAIAGGNWVSRNESDTALNRSMFPCTVYLRKLTGA